MTNSTDTLLETLTDAFILWFNNDILPVCAVVIDLLIIIIGVILNIMLIVTFRKRGLFNEPSTCFVLAMCVMDFVAYALLLVPNVIAAIATEWLLSKSVCEFQGAMIGALLLGQFYILILLSIERTLKLVERGEKYYDRFFANEKTVRIIIGITCGVTTLVAFIPVTGAGEVRYDFYHFGCMLDYKTSVPFLLLHFILTICASFVSYLICYILIYNEKRKAIVKNRLECFKKAHQKPSETSMANDSSLTTITEDDDVFPASGGSSDQERIVKSPGSNGRRNTMVRPRSRPKSSPRQSMVFEVFSDDDENPAFHLAVTYLFLWSAIVLCYLPYFIAAFYDGFSSGTVWGGIYTVTLLVTHVSFVAKPIIYLGHNRQYREVTKETVPQAIRNRARSVRNSVISIGSKVEDFVFKSKTNKRFVAAISAHKAVLVWKKKLKLKETKGNLNLSTQLGNDTDANKDVLPKSILMTKTSEAPAVDPESQPTTNKTVGNLKVGFANSRHNTITPSSIDVAPASSYIERERQRMAAINGGVGGGIDQTSVVHRGPSPQVHVTSLHVTDDEAGSVVPGVVDERDTGSSPAHVKPW